MIDIAADTTVDASPETVFEFIATPDNHPKILPSLVEISDVVETDIGKRGRYEFKMVGQPMEGEFTDTEFDRPTQRSYDLTGDIEGTVSWSIEPEDDATLVTYQQRTHPPGPDMLEAVTEPVVTKFLQREADTMMENLRTLVEEDVTATA